MKNGIPDGKEISFEEAYRQLEALVGSLESGQCELEDSLESYEKGIALLRICRQKLAGVSRRVELLKGIDDQGASVLEQLDETTLSSRTDVAGRQNSRTSASDQRVASSVPGKCKAPSSPSTNEQRVDAPVERRVVRPVEQPGRSVRPEDEALQRRRAPIRRTTRSDGSALLFDDGGTVEAKAEQATRNRGYFDPSGEPPF